MSFTIVEKEYICSREKYLELKELQKKMAIDLKSIKNSKKVYYQKRREFYHSKGVNVPEFKTTYVETGTIEKHIFRKTILVPRFLCLVTYSVDWHVGHLKCFIYPIFSHFIPSLQAERLFTTDNLWTVPI